MNYQFVLIDYDKQNIDNKNYLCIYVLETNKKTIFRIFKNYNEEFETKLFNIDKFENITDKISFVIKRDGKISLNINI